MQCNVTLNFFGDSDSSSSISSSLICRMKADPLYGLQSGSSNGRVWSEILVEIMNQKNCTFNFALCGEYNGPNI